MTTQITLNKVLVKDNLGWPCAEAFVVIWDIDEVVKTKSTSVNGIGDYVESSRSHVIKYKGNYWFDKETQLAGLPSRPLAHFVQFDAQKDYEKNEAGEYVLDDNGDKKETGDTIPAHEVWTDYFTVDMDHAESRLIRSSGITGNAEREKLIDKDVKRRFPTPTIEV